MQVVLWAAIGQQRAHHAQYRCSPWCWYAPTAYSISYSTIVVHDRPHYSASGVCTTPCPDIPYQPQVSVHWCGCSQLCIYRPGCRPSDSSLVKYLLQRSTITLNFSHYFYKVKGSWYRTIVLPWTSDNNKHWFGCSGELVTWVKSPELVQRKWQLPWSHSG